RRRRMMHPDPSVQSLRGIRAQLLFQTVLDLWPVPPRAYREEGVAKRKTVAVAGNAKLAYFADPACDLLAFRIALVEVVIAGAEDHPGDAGQQREVLLHHHDLRAEIHEGADIERVARKDHEIELGRSRQQPVELRQ